MDMREKERRELPCLYSYVQSEEREKTERLEK